MTLDDRIAHIARQRPPSRRYRCPDARPCGKCGACQRARRIVEASVARDERALWERALGPQSELKEEAGQ